MKRNTGKFASLFHKYRLQAEYPTLTSFGDVLAEKGYIYEDSIFSRWQNGSRVPSDRGVMLSLIAIFVERGVVRGVEQADELMQSVGMEGLSGVERERYGLRESSYLFQVPREISDFTGREELIKKVVGIKGIEGKVVLLHGPAGVGKTALAIKLAHKLKHKYPDGVLWYKVESGTIGDILFSIAESLGESIGKVRNIHANSTFVRTLLSKKSVLLILDNVEETDSIYLLFPNSKTSSVIVTTQMSSIKYTNRTLSFFINSFTEKETIELFKGVMGKKYDNMYKKAILQAAKRMGYLPLSLHILARRITHANLRSEQIITILNEQELAIRELQYEDKSLYAVIEISFNRLNSIMRSVLISASIFNSMDFSSNQIAYVNSIRTNLAFNILENLVDMSLVEHSTYEKYRLHPTIQIFVRSKLEFSSYAKYYKILLLMYIVSVVYWLFFTITSSPSANFHGYIVQLPLMIIPLWGGVLGVKKSATWGGFNNMFGKTLGGLSLGLIFWGLGMVVWNYYIFFEKVEIPYPSVADIFFITGFGFWIYCVYYLSKIIGFRTGLKSIQGKMLFVAALVASVIVSYYLQVVLVLGGSIDITSVNTQLFFDLLYPFTDTVVLMTISVVYVVSAKYLNGWYKKPTLVLFSGFLINYFADFVFSYTIGNGTYFNGNIADLLFLTAMMVLSYTISYWELSDTK